MERPGATPERLLLPCRNIQNELHAKPKERVDHFFVALQRVAHEWVSLGTTKTGVNLSAVQIECCDVYEVVMDALHATGLPAQRLQLEITESVLMRDHARTQEVLRKLHDLGVLITLDDFGTCFATLNYLRSFPFKKIKIDRSFVRDIPEHHDCMAIVKSVADLARELNMRSVAEGVETAAALACVRAAGYDEAQGFYFSPPVPISAIERTVQQCAARLASLNASGEAAKRRKAAPEPKSRDL